MAKGGKETYSGSLFASLADKLAPRSPIFSRRSSYSIRWRCNWLGWFGTFGENRNGVTMRRCNPRRFRQSQIENLFFEISPNSPPLILSSVLS
jgi:hypothetical protein